MVDPLYTADYAMLKETRFGLMLFNKNDVYIGRSLEKYGEFSQGEAKLFENIIRPGQVVVEVGANIGAHTLQIAKAVGHKGRVYAFEPQRIVYQMLCANMALNETINAFCYQAAVSVEPGMIKVPLLTPTAEQNVGGLSLGEWEEGEDVPVMTIDGLKISGCHFMKVDVEGMEEGVLRGAKETIMNYRPILYVENDRKEKSHALIQFIEELNYRLYWHLPPLFSPNNFYQDSENIFGNTVSVNMLCLPAESKIEVKGMRSVSGPDDDWQRPSGR